MKSRNAKNGSTLILPHPSSTRDQLTPFLKAKDLRKKGTTPIALLGVLRKSNSRFGDGIEVACKVGNKNYTLTVKYDSGNYSRLFDRFGRKKWNGIVNVERKEYMGHEYVAVVD
jgi:hypothetical protein